VVIPTARTTLRLGTRRSVLATTQSRWVADRLAFPTELVTVTTEGDVSTAPLAALGGTGVFVTALRGALLEGRVDLAVHSLKDLPTTPEPGVVVAAIPRREDPRDVLVARDGLTLSGLPSGARVGTGSPRRAALLRAVRPDLDVVDVRGNVDTRLRFVADGALDAVVLALAGLARLGRAAEATEVLGPPVMLPAPGQGALAVECREDDTALVGLLAQLDDPATRAAVTAERRLLRTLEAGCAAPLGALGVLDERRIDGARLAGATGELSLEAVVASLDGRRVLRARAFGTAGDAEALGERVARQLLEDGAAALVAPSPSFASSTVPVPEPVPQPVPEPVPQPGKSTSNTIRTASASDADSIVRREGDQ
jgi:hydroxymethylbilane synthase